MGALSPEYDTATVINTVQNNRVLLWTAQADETNEKGIAPKGSKETAELQRARETW